MRMTMARLDAGERLTLADWLRKVGWYLSARYPSYRNALYDDEQRRQQSHPDR